ncbi:InlB B-repeat-containing protein, partial [Treponema pedis]|uniref:InlB B-repeat-containing protein n=1 Tax=Treponema pedis TaxID=409322 RepID=UPI0004677362
MNNVRFKQRAQLLIVGVITLAVSLVFTACPDTAGGGRGTGVGTVPTGQTFLVTFGVEGSINGTLKAEIDGTRLFSSPSQVEKGKTVTFTATPSDPSNYNVDYWTITGGTIISGGQPGDTETKIEVTSPVTLTVVFKAVGDPHTTHTVTFAVSGTGGTLNAEADGVNLPTSPAQVNVNAPLVLTAVPQEDCAVDTWTVTGGTIISGGQPGDTETIIRVTSPVTVELRFKAAAYDVYLAGTVKVGEEYKACMWKNDTPMLLNSYKSSQAYALAQDTDKEIYIAGYE